MQATAKTRPAGLPKRLDLPARGRKRAKGSPKPFTGVGVPKQGGKAAGSKHNVSSNVLYQADAAILRPLFGEPR
jgi:hypothetical protein